MFSIYLKCRVFASININAHVDLRPFLKKTNVKDICIKPCPTELQIKSKRISGNRDIDLFIYVSRVLTNDIIYLESLLIYSDLKKKSCIMDKN